MMGNAYPPLTMADNIAEIVRYWDKSAECEEKKRNGQWVAKSYKIDEELIRCFYAGEVRNIRPILRDFKDVTGEEWQEAFRLAFYHTEIVHDVKWRVGLGYVELDYEYDMLKLVITVQGVIVASSYRMGNTGPARINVLALYDYLDSLSIDIRGMLQKGLAVEGTV